MKVNDYKEIANDLLEVIWDIEDMLDKHSVFTNDRFESLTDLYEMCSKYMRMYKKYEETFFSRLISIDWEEVVHNLNYIKNVLMHYSGDIDYLCNYKLMGHNLDLNERQFDLNLEMLCLTIKEVDSKCLGGAKNVRENKFDIVGGIEIYDDEFLVCTLTMAEIKEKYIEYRNPKTNQEISNL